MPAIHCAITRRVRPGCEEPFDEKLLAFVRESIATDGVVGVHILRPAPDNNDREYGVPRSFESEAAAERFYASDVFNRWLLDVEPLVEGEPIHRKLTGSLGLHGSSPRDPNVSWLPATPATQSNESANAFQTLVTSP